jgi:hypothetical protein
MAFDQLDDVSYFVDENLLGFHKLLMRSGRTDSIAPGDDRCPSIPLGTPDLDWMPIVSRSDLIVISRDRRIGSRPAELDVFRGFGIRSVWLGGKRDLRPDSQLSLFLRYEARLLQFAAELGAGPWMLNITASGVRSMPIRP